MIKIYLDLNKYIELSRLWHELDEDSSGILKFLVAKRMDNKAIFPICASHVIEMAKHSDLDKRKRLAQTMWFFSGGLILLNRTEILNFEIDQAIETIKNLSPQTTSNNFFCTALLRGFPPVTDIASGEIFDKKLWIDIVSSSNENSRKEAINLIFEKARAISDSINNNRKILDKETQNTAQRALMALMLLDTQEIVLSRLIKANIKSEDIKKLWKEKVIKLYENIPSLNIEVQLKYHAFKNKQKNTVENDIFDWGALSSAINYYDILITEKYWENIAKQAKLNLKYNAIIEGDLKKLFSLI